MKKRNQVARSVLVGVLAVGLTATIQAAESRIYRTVDADGNVVFTDIPPREDEKGEQIIVTNPNSFTSNDASGPRDEWIVEGAEADQPDAEDEKPFAYESLVIKSPEDDQAVRENAGNITIVAVAKPRMQTGHTMRLLMDGQVVQEGPQSNFALQHVDRGTHAIATEIVDERGQILIRSESSTFHMLRVAGGG